MRILITGASGFVGPHLAASLRRHDADVAIFPTAKDAYQRPDLGLVDALDVTNRTAVDSALARSEPTCVIHLAGIAAPVSATADPQLAWRVHVQGTLNVAYSISQNAPKCALLFVSSGLIYGASALSGQPVDEETLLAPMDEYSATKAAADLALGALARKGLKCVRLRPFNHTGRGQDEAFVIPAFAMQIARIEAGLQPPVIRVGNLDAERDFLDVRDVAVAYTLAAFKSGELAPGTIINVASGIPRRVGDMLEQLLRLSTTPIAIEPDTARMRPSDLPKIVGNAERARRRLGWAPQHSFEDTLADVMDDCRARVSRL